MDCDDAKEEISTYPPFWASSRLTSSSAGIRIVGAAMVEAAMKARRIATISRWASILSDYVGFLLTGNDMSTEI